MKSTYERLLHHGKVVTAHNVEGHRITEQLTPAIVAEVSAVVQ